MSTLADKDAAVVQHHPGEEESKVPEEVLHFAVATRVRAVDNLDNVFPLDWVLFWGEAQKFLRIFKHIKGH